MKSKDAIVVGLVITSILVTVIRLYGQDALQSSRIAGLRKLPELAIVMQPGGDRTVDTLTFKEIHDIVLVFLKSKLPLLKLSRGEDSTSWFAVEYRTAPNGGLVRVALYRWVTISGTGERAFVATWDNSLLVTDRFNRQDFKEALEQVLTNFAADYYRANP